MNTCKQMFKLSALAAAFVFSSSALHANIIISEIDPTGSSATYAADWFELTNTGTSAVDISGWKMDDNSNAFGSSVALRGITSIAAGQSVIFLEGNTSGSTDATLNNAFKTAWFGSNTPAGFLIGNYGGSGVGLGNTGDAVNIFDSAGTLITNVQFGASTAGFTFDNKAGLNNTSISTLSAVGINGAKLSASGAEVGSPGAVPLPAALPLLISAFGLLGGARRLRRTK